MPVPRPPRMYAGRMMTGRPMSDDGAPGVGSGVGDSRDGHFEADLDHRRLEQLAVLGRRDRIGIGADHLRRALDADQPVTVEIHRDVEAGLAAEGRQHGVG
ncbi:MAG: hypothetical protein WKF58_12990, partial [Ilumatobacteraceae bacterium]